MRTAAQSSLSLGRDEALLVSQSKTQIGATGVTRSGLDLGPHYNLIGLLKGPPRLREPEYRQCRQYFWLPIMTFPLAQRKSHINIAASS
ncbi:hypothetical protein NDU88_001519 [Pleurodeles waltl]|uniref:Uncharacterized protein n=1 Tax=Pleurodeles waltl TaxID=8319 RepID=A0AAV7TII7_PLEWA|nr:hypothetical protein NDU88_001519 [Pleurodeles waltl]